MVASLPGKGEHRHRGCDSFGSVTVEKIGLRLKLRAAIVSVAPTAGKAFTPRPQRNSAPSVVKALRHGGHGERRPRAAMPKRGSLARPSADGHRLPPRRTRSPGGEGFQSPAIHRLLAAGLSHL